MSLSPLPHAGPRRAGFTLIELLVSMTVLILLVVMVAQLTSSATNTTTASTKRVDADTQARDVFNRMSADFTGMIRRKDVDCFFVKNGVAGGTGTNDAMYFYTDAIGFNANHNFDKNHALTTLVGYHIANRGAGVGAQYPDNVLERVGRGLVYDGGDTASEDNMIFLTFPPAAASQPDTLPVPESTLAYSKKTFISAASPTTWDNPKTTNSNTQNYNFILSDAVFRLEFCFLWKDPIKQGSDKDPAKAYAVPPDAGGTPWMSADFMTKIHVADRGYASMRQVANGDVAAVVVTIAVLDAKSRLLVNAAQMALMRGLLKDGNTPDVAATWNAAIAAPPGGSSFSAKAQVPTTVASQVRVYQRFFYLP